ncbi:MAG: YkgJ family cysteine cluster protein [Deferribacterales bacterium]
MVSVKDSSFLEQIKKLADGYLENGTDSGNLCRMMKKLFAVTQQHIDQTIPAEQKAMIMCRSGCSHCCRVHVPVLMPEAVIIASYLRNSSNPAVLGRMISNMEKLSLDISSYDEEERVAANKKCIFLGRMGDCSIHPVRPFACRSVVSADDKACRESMRLTLLDEPVLVPINFLNKSINDSAFMGLAESMKDHGIDDRSVEITSGVLACLR